MQHTQGSGADVNTKEINRTLKYGDADIALMRLFSDGTPHVIEDVIE